MLFKIGDKVRVLGKGRGLLSVDGEDHIGKVLTISKIESQAIKGEIGYALFEELTHTLQSGIWLSQLELVQGDTMIPVEPLPSGASSTGTKNDSGKSRISLIPTDALVGMGNALKYGEQKYGTHNYRNGLAFSRLVDACLRHLSSWNEGENNDPESGLSHLDHALASLAMLKFMDVNRQDMDDRWLNPIHGDPEVDQKSLYEQAKEIQKRGR